MIIKIMKCLIMMLFIFLTTGCWDYIGVDEITIVTGVAVDMNENMDEYKLSFEVIHPTGSSRQQQEIKTEILESTGSTIFDAIRNAKKRVMNKLYFSNTQVVLISNQIAREKGINSVLDFYLRDAETRETLSLIISKEKTAQELLKKNSMDSPVTSFEIQKILKDDNTVVSSTEYSQMYKIFDTLNCEGKSLTLPLFHNIENDHEQVIEANGIAVFKKDKLVDYLTANESKNYLFIEDDVDGGIITLDANDDKTDDLSIEIDDSSTSKSFSYDNDKYKFDISVEIDGFVGEYSRKYKEVDLKKLKEIEKMTEKQVTKNIKKLIEKAQNELKIDIFSFGNLVYRTNPKLWKKIEKNWNNLFLEIEVNVEVKVNILNTAFVK